MNRFGSRQPDKFSGRESRRKLIWMALLAQFCMAPNFYFPIIVRPCPSPQITSMVTYQYYLGYRPYSYSATIQYGKFNPLISINAFDVVTGEALDDDGSITWFVNDEESTVEKFFDIRDCNLTGKPYQVRFEMVFAGGCSAELFGEFVPLEIHGGPQCKP